MPKLSLHALECPISATLDVIGGRWKPLILYYLLDGPKRFNELRRCIPIVTQRILTQHLRELEANGVVSRTVFDRVPPHVEYAYTERGRSLVPILEAMAAWGATDDRKSATLAVTAPDQPSVSAMSQVVDMAIHDGTAA